MGDHVTHRSHVIGQRRGWGRGRGMDVCLVEVPDLEYTPPSHSYTANKTRFGHFILFEKHDKTIQRGSMLVYPPPSKNYDFHVDSAPQEALKY